MLKMSCAALELSFFVWKINTVVSATDSLWLLVLSHYKEDYLQIFKCVFFWLQGCCD